MESQKMLQYNFVDILAERRQEKSNLFWVSRRLNNVLAYQHDIQPYPFTHKQEVIDSLRIQEIIENISAETGISKTEIQHQVRLILDEIGYNKQLKIIRWLGLFLAKVCQRVSSGIYCNDNSINLLKSQMGHCPVIFAPSHRSYADFILMSYLCFTYNIEIPAIAAGMDFHGMWGMGTVLRNTGAFFMRRSYNDDHLYWYTFKQYVHQLVTRGELPIEFFIEGTRSRSCKSLVPKFGLLSMMMKPLFTSEVPDVLIVPISISYDRVLEERLFAFELLGIPKPKESTSGFFKSLSIVKEKYGNMYVNFAKPISVKEYFGEHLERSKHAIKPIHMQEILPSEKKLISSIAYDIVRTQQDNCVITTFNLIAVLLSNNIIIRQNLFSSKELVKEIDWLKSIMEILGAFISINNETLDEALAVHKNIIEVDNESKINLIYAPIVLTNLDPSKLKGYALSETTMTNIVPLIILQLYVNPCMHHLINASIIIVILKSVGRNEDISKDDLFGHYRFLRCLFSHEFVFCSKRETMDFESTLKHLELLHVIEQSNEKVNLTENEKLQILLCNMLLPFFSAYQTVCHFLHHVSINTFFEQSTVLINVQKMLEMAIVQSDLFIHPYCLSLDTLSICLQSLASMKILIQQRMNGKLKYKVNPQELNSITEKIGRYTYFYNMAFMNAFESTYYHSKL